MSNCEKLLGPRINFSPFKGDGPADYLKKEDYFNRGNEHVGEIKEVDNPGTDGRGREKVDFELQIFKVARS